MDLAAPLSIIVADDHAPTRASVCRALADDGFEVLGEASDASAAVDLALQGRPQIALLDVRMPGDGIEAAARIASSLPGTSVVILTVSSDDDDLFAALGVGVSGYLLKGLPASELPQMLRRVVEGEAVLPESLVTRLVNEFHRRERRRGLAFQRRSSARLSARELEVLELLDAGNSTAEIAQQLYIARVTVRSHISAIVRKLGVADRDQAVEALRARP